jgi:hypothetical protein
VTFDEFWKGRVPDEPNFITFATEAAEAAKTQEAELLEEVTGTP